MTLKRALLASSAVALSAAGVADAHSPYITVFGGVNLLNDKSAAQTSGVTVLFGSTSYDADYDSGFVMGGAVGTKLEETLPGLRLEVEASWRRNEMGGRFHEFDFFGHRDGIIDAEQSTFAVMANLWYDIDLGGKLVPYIGGGAGWARTHADGVFYRTAVTPGVSQTFDVDGSGFAWQLGAGFKYPVDDGVTLGLGYRYFRGPDIDNNVFIGKHDLPVAFERENHAVTLDLTFELD